MKTYENDKYILFPNENRVDSIVIMDNEGVVLQEMSGLDRAAEEGGTGNDACKEDMYGLSFDDWNFDGYLDISLWRFLGGSMRNNPTYYWLWDNNSLKFIENKELEEMSDFSKPEVNSELKQVTGYTRYSASGGIFHAYEYRNGSFVMVESYEWNGEPSPEDEEKYVLHVIIKELINGKMTTTQDYFQDVAD